MSRAHAFQDEIEAANSEALPPWSRRNWPNQKLREHWPHLTLNQVDMLAEVFAYFDTDSNGYFTWQELYFVMKNMTDREEIPTAEVDAVLAEMDSNGDQLVDFAEFVAKFHDVHNAAALKNVFTSLNLWENGVEDQVTIAALERCFTYVGDPLSAADRKYVMLMFGQGAGGGGHGASTSSSAQHASLSMQEFIERLERLDDDMYQLLGKTTGQDRPGGKQGQEDKEESIPGRNSGVDPGTSSGASGRDRPRGIQSVRSEPTLDS